jgi:hypothetical protein
MPCRTINRAKTELLVMVTPELIQPLDALDPKLQPNIPIEGLPPALLPSAGASASTERLACS